jgi:ferredoxin
MLAFLKKIRFYTAAVAVFIMNLNVFGYSLKGICTPGFSCHSCPWATSACPIGVFAFGSAVRKLPILAITSILMVGLAVGRLVCGFFCPFGFLQDLLHKIPLPKIKLPKFTRYFKYAALLLLVFVFPYFLGFEQSGFIKLERPGIDKNDDGGIDVTVTIENISEKTVTAPDIKLTYIDKESKEEVYSDDKSYPDLSIPAGETITLPIIKAPNHLGNADLFVTSPQSNISQAVPYKLYFCKICPTGTLTASIPGKFTSAATTGTFASSGWFELRYIILYVFLILMLISSRPFCRILCPLGALYGLTAKLSAVTMSVDKDACINCGKCNKVCPVGLDVVNEIDGSECIACGDCKTVCPVNCITRDIRLKPSPCSKCSTACKSG